MTLHHLAVNSPLLALTAALGDLLTASTCAQVKESDLPCAHVCARGRTCVCPLRRAGQTPSTSHRRTTSSHRISVLRAQSPTIWGARIPKLSNSGRLYGSLLLPAAKYVNNSCKCFSLCYSVKTEDSASDSCWCSSVCEHSLSSALPSDCLHLGATALNLVGFWNAVQVSI